MKAHKEAVSQLEEEKDEMNGDMEHWQEQSENYREQALQLAKQVVKQEPLQLKSHYAFNVNKLQETKSPLSLLMGSQQSHLHIDVLFIQNFGCFAKFERVKKFHNNKSGLICVYIHQGTPCMHCSLFLKFQIMPSVGLR